MLYSLMGTVVSPNISSFPDALATMVESFTISQPLADAVLASGLWNTSDEFSACELLRALLNKMHSSSILSDNASQSVDTDHFLTCDGVAWNGAAATHKVFPSHKNVRFILSVRNFSNQLFLVFATVRI